LAQLRTEADDSATLPSEAVQNTENAPEPEETEPSETEAPPAVTAEKEEVTASPDEPDLKVEEVSLALWGDTTWPKDLDQKKLHVHIGAVHSRFGSLEGFAANLLTLQNLGRGKNGA